MSLCQCGCGGETKVMTRTYGLENIQRGESRRFLSGHNAVGRPTIRYRKGQRQYLHRARAERALGHALPPTAVVHHADGTKRDDAPLVICPDDAYHIELHRKMRVQAAGGNPWTEQICSRCQQVLAFDAFAKDRRKASGYWQYCKPCDRARKTVSVGSAYV